MINIDKVSKSYGKDQVLDEVGLSIDKGKFTAFIGPNGAGKSTLLNLLGMRLDDRRNSHRKENRRSYFLMYHLYDDYYGFEFSDSSYIEGDQKITNINMHGIEVRQSLYKPWVSLISSLEDNKLVYKNTFFKK